MFNNSDFIEELFKSNELVVNGSEEREGYVKNVSDDAGIFIREYVSTPSNMLVCVDAALLSILFASDEDENKFVILCNCRYADLDKLKVFDGGLKIERYIDAPANTIFSFGAIKKLVADGELAADKGYNFNIGIVTSDCNGKPYPINEEIVDLTGVAFEGDCMVLMHNVKDIIEFQNKEAEELDAEADISVMIDNESNVDAIPAEEEPNTSAVDVDYSDVTEVDLEFDEAAAAQMAEDAALLEPVDVIVEE